jgi:hypothetical protein|tara:strand:- start:10175 stop:10363 length:189 start_codon:yes stop_codon:yes gene_type:complete
MANNDTDSVCNHTQPSLIISERLPHLIGNTVMTSWQTSPSGAVMAEAASIACAKGIAMLDSN